MNRLNIHPTTRALYRHIPEAHPISPAGLWAYREEGIPDESFPRLVADLAAMARAGLIKRHSGAKAMYTRGCLTIEGAVARSVTQRFESGLRFKDGVWVRVDEVSERNVA